MKVYEAVANAFVREGTDTVFGLLGDGQPSQPPGASRSASGRLSRPRSRPRARWHTMNSTPALSEKRSPLVPGLPTMIESGVPGYTMGLSVGMLAPAGTAVPVVRRLNRDIVEILRVAEVKDMFLSQGAEPIGGTPEQYRAHMAAELKRYRAVVKEAGIRLQ